MEDMNFARIEMIIDQLKGNLPDFKQLYEYHKKTIDKELEAVDAFNMVKNRDFAESQSALTAHQVAAEAEQQMYGQREGLSAANNTFTSIASARSTNADSSQNQNQKKSHVGLTIITDKQTSKPFWNSIRFSDF